MSAIMRVSELTDRQFAALPKDTIALVPLGSIEPHGHLPLGTDCMIPESILERVAAEVPGTCLFPTLPLGYLFKYARWPGAVGVSAAVVQSSTQEICRGLASVGIVRALFMSGHDENREPVVLGLQDANVAYGSVGVYCDWLDLAWKLAMDLSTSRREGHASEIQTSVLQYLRPELNITVAPAQATPPVAPVRLGEDDMFASSEAGIWVRQEPRRESSHTGDPSPANSETGRLIVQRIVQRASEILAELRQTDAGE